MGCNGCINRGIAHTEGSSDFMVSESRSKLAVINWLEEYGNRADRPDLVEVRFKNTRKEIYTNENRLRLFKGTVVAVEAQFGHDIGTISMTGDLVRSRIRQSKIDPGKREVRNLLRRATARDKQVWLEAMELEQPVMIRTRQIVKELGLVMKISDVEYQGDKSKAVFYYIASDRIDFRELIKILAKEFGIRIEMKQIGVRQEAGRIGGIGSCGRELCCSSWKTNFQSIGLETAKLQELPGNAQKLAGQCGKLKCCLLYELDNYVEAREHLPKVLLELETEKGIAYHHKTDVLKRIMYYSYERESTENLIPVSVDRVKEIIQLNKKGVTAIKLDTLIQAESTINYTL
jgi:cell fate regulator YaaT (PSP1 superfamily)